MNKLNRWWIALAGVLLQMALGAVYAWSVFRVPPYQSSFSWTISQVTLTFTVAIMVLGFASFFRSGLWIKNVEYQSRRDDRPEALYGLGVFLASFSSIGLWWLYSVLWSHRRHRPWIFRTIVPCLCSAAVVS